MSVDIKWQHKDPFPTDELVIVRGVLGSPEKIMTAREYVDGRYTSGWVLVSYLEKIETKITVEATPRPQAPIDALAEFARLDRKDDLKYKRKLCEANICRLSELLKQNRELLQKLNEEMASL